MSDSEFDYKTKFPPVGWIPESLRPKLMMCGHYSKSGTKVHPDAKLCADCYNAKVVAKARELEQALELPKLVGTPKQIAWASNIRATKLLGLFHTLQQKDSAKLNAKADWFRTETSAEAIINSRRYHTGAKTADIFPELGPAIEDPPPQTEGTETIDE